MLDMYKVLLGPVTLDSLKTAIGLSMMGATLEAEVGALAAFDHTLRSSVFYGLEPNEHFTEVALVGRYQIVNFGGKQMLILCALEGDEAKVFAEIIGKSANEMCEIYDLKVNSNPRSPLPNPLLLAKAQLIENDITCVETVQ